MRSSKHASYSVDEARVECCRKEILRPFIEGVRKTNFPELVNCAPLLLRMADVSWLHSDFSQMKVLTELENAKLDKELYLIGNK